MYFIDRAAQAGRWRWWPAGEKLLLALGVMGISLGVAGWIGQGLLLALMVGLTIGAARVPVGTWLKAACIPMGFILMGMLAQFIALDIRDGGLSVALVSEDDMVKAVFVGMRSFVCVTALLFLALTTPLASLMHLLQRLGLRGELTDVAFLMLRFVWLVFDSLQTGQRAQDARLGRITARRWLRSSALLAAGLLPRTLDRARRMTMGLDARCSTGTLNVLSLERTASPTRLALLAGAIACVGGGLAWIG